MRGAIDALGAWLARHEETADHITVWALLIGFTVLFLVETGTWLVLRGSRDQTPVGVWLKRKKVGYAVLGVGMATLYGATLWISYGWPGAPRIGVWERTVLRLVVLGGTGGAAISGIMFIRALWRRAGQRRATR